MKIIRCATGLATTAGRDRLHGQRKLAANIYSLHSFRHTFVSFCANSGVPLAVVAEIVGHGNPAMTEHYSHISTESKREAIKALPSICITTSQDDDVIDEPLSLRRKAIAEALETVGSDVLDEVEQLLKARELKRQDSVYLPDKVEQSASHLPTLKKSRREGLQSFDLRDAGLSDMAASRPHQLLLHSGGLLPFLADSHVQEWRDEHVSGGVCCLLSVLDWFMVQAKMAAFRPSRPKALFRAR